MRTSSQIIVGNIFIGRSLSVQRLALELELDLKSEPAFVFGLFRLHIGRLEALVIHKYEFHTRFARV